MPFPFGRRKVKIPREEFAKLLFVWLLRSLSIERIREDAKALALDESEDTTKLFGFNLDNNEDLDKLQQEIFVFNMWSIVVTCELVFKDIDKRNECLDMFHRLVYDEFLEGKKEDFQRWKLSISERYTEYYEAMKTEHPLGPSWGLASLLNEKLFEGLNLDAFVQFQIGTYMKSSMNATEGLVKEYEVK